MPRVLPRHLPAVLAALATCVTSIGLSAPVQAVAAPEAVVTLVSPSSDDVVGPVVTASFDVTLNGQVETTLLAQVGSVTQSRTVTRAACPATCRLDLVLRTGESFDDQYSVSAGTLHYEWTTPSGGDGVGVWLDRAPVPAVAHQATRTATTTDATVGYDRAVVDTTATFDYALAPGSTTRPWPGEVVELRATGPTGSTGSTEVARRTASWTTRVDGTPGASATIDFSSLPEGAYDVVSRARAADGTYGFGSYQRVVVRHTPAITVTTDAGPRLAGPAQVVDVSLRGPLAQLPQAVEVSLDGSVVGQDGDPRLALMRREDAALTLHLDTGPATLGRHLVSARTTSRGAVLAVAPRPAAFDVVTLGPRLVPPVAFVGRTVVLSATATAPVGRTVHSLSGEITGPDGLVTLGAFCLPCAGRSATGTMSFTPRRAGTARYTLWADATDPLVESATGTFPVYAYRRVSAVTAPATAYGALQKVSLRLTDDRGSGPVASPAGVPVTVQLKRAGTTTWTPVASGRTGAGGSVALSFTSRANGQLRVSYLTPAPGTSWLSATSSTTSVAGVSVTSAPTTGVRKRTVTVKATSSPSEPGVKLSLQTRLRGTASWRTVRTVPAASNGGASSRRRSRRRGPTSCGSPGPRRPSTRPAPRRCGR